jgi:hypothetical protein
VAGIDDDDQRCEGDSSAFFRNCCEEGVDADEERFVEDSGLPPFLASFCPHAIADRVGR